MKKGVVRIAALALGILAQAAWAVPKRVLHYYRCTFSGFGCGSPDDTADFQQLASEYGFAVKHSRDSSDLLNAAQYDLIVFDNAGDAGGAHYSGDPGAPFRAFQAYMESGGRFLGLHGASDHRGFWAWYDTVLFSGAHFLKFDESAPYPPYIYRDTSAAARSDSALARMWKYAEDSLGIRTDAVRIKTAVMHFNLDVAGMPGVRVLQELRGGNALNGVRETFSWAKTFPGGGRMLYTALGHRPNDWADQNGWLKKAVYAYMRYLVGDFDARPEAAAPRMARKGGSVEIRAGKGSRFRVTDLRGRPVASGTGPAPAAFDLGPGVYILIYGKAGALSSRTFVIP